MSLDTIELGATTPQADTLSYSQRLATFGRHWQQNIVTARQLAALGHVQDPRARGSCCVSCKFFLYQIASTAALEGDIFSQAFAQVAQMPPRFHEDKCAHRQKLVPYDQVNWIPPDRPASGRRGRLDCSPKQSALLRLPVELRVQIYEYVLARSQYETIQMDDHPRARRCVAGTKTPGPALQSLHPQPQMLGGPEGLSLRPQPPFLGVPPTPRRRARAIARLASLLTVCKSVYHEVLDFVYSKSKLVFRYTDSLYFFLRQIGKDGRRAIRTVEISLGERDDAIALALLAACTNLDSLTVTTSKAYVQGRINTLWSTDGMACLRDVCRLEKLYMPSEEIEQQFREHKRDAQSVILQLGRPSKCHLMPEERVFCLVPPDREPLAYGSGRRRARAMAEAEARARQATQDQMPPAQS